MTQRKTTEAALLGACLIVGLAVLGYLLGQAVIDYREYERSVTVKGLSEREYPANIVIWPIRFTVASNDLNQLYTELDRSESAIQRFLSGNGIDAGEISTNQPKLTDKDAQNWGDNQAQFRYTADQTVTVYSGNIDKVRGVMSQLSQLGRQGIVLSGNEYQTNPEYLFTRLNDVKPDMVEEATRNAREVAQKFAEDSQSSLGRIKRASQGHFSISPRDNNTPHIKKVRVVSTVEYYLAD
ncbi:MAG: SIMPL domain-containing protein [Amphritea sp.]|nr:SIMPL domain-containing protein [Amphritea sp.]